MSYRYPVMNNRWGTIHVDTGALDGTKGFGDQVYAEFDPYLGMNMRTKVGRRRLRRFAERLLKLSEQYEARYDD